MAMSNPIKDLTRPNLTKSTFQGYVVDNNDPDKRQRVKIRIPILHRNVPDEHLPWVMPSSKDYPHAGSGVGSVFVPVPGTLMEVYFDEDDPHNPRYSGSPPVDSVNKDNEILNEDYPMTRGYVDSSGNKVTVNTQRNEMLWQHKSGSTIFIDGAGNISITAAGSLTFSAPGDVTVASGGAMKLHAGGNTDIKGKMIDLNGSSSQSQTSTPAKRPTPQIPSPKGKTHL